MSKNTTKGIILAVLGIIAAVVVYTQIFTLDEEERQRRELMAQRQRELASGQPAAAPSAPGAPAAPGGPVLREDEIDLDALATGIKEVEFDYTLARREAPFRNPMAPLVGPHVAPALAQPGVADALPPDDEATLAAIRRNLRLSGIMWHPTAPAAIINNEIVPLGYEFPGEMFRTARATQGALENSVLVESMTQDSVILKYKDTEIALELKER